MTGPMRSLLVPARRALADGTDAAAAWAGRQPAIRAVRCTWDRLLDEAGGLLTPLAERIRPEVRIVAVPRQDGGIDLSRVARGVATPIAEGEPTGRTGRLELRLRDDQLLERSLSLPTASRDFLGTIIEHRLERLTPWRRETVLHGFAITDTNPDGGALTVRLLMTSTEIVEPALAALRARGLVPTGIGGLANEPAVPMPIVLGHGATAPPRPAWLVAGGRLWLAGSGALAVIAVMGGLWASAAADRQVEAEQHLAKARRLIRNAGAGPLGGAEQQFAAAKRPDAATVVLIDKLATALPDTAFLREMALTQADVRLVGTATDAPALIPLLAQAGFFNVRFTAPVARGDDRRDAFEITADRAPKEAAP